MGKKGSKLDLNMKRYIHGKDWDARLQGALVTERIKPQVFEEKTSFQFEDRVLNKL